MLFQLIAATYEVCRKLPQTGPGRPAPSRPADAFQIPHSRRRAAVTKPRHAASDRRTQRWQRATWRRCSAAPASSAATSSSGWRTRASWCALRCAIPEAALFLKTAGGVGQIVPLFASVENEATVHRAVEGAGLVVNLVGILAESRAGDFQRIHAEGAGRVARLAAAAGVERLVHVSAIGADPASPSTLRHQQGGRRASGAGGVPRRHHPPPVDRVRPRGPFLQPLRRAWRGCRRSCR